MEFYEGEGHGCGVVERLYNPLLGYENSGSLFPRLAEKSFPSKPPPPLKEPPRCLFTFPPPALPSVLWPSGHFVFK